MLTQKNGTTVWQTEPKRLPHTEAHRESLGPRLVVPVLPIDTEVLSASLECVLAGLLDWPHGTLLAVTELILQRVVLMFAQTGPAPPVCPSRLLLNIRATATGSL
jgi:hypothetical protein